MRIEYSNFSDDTFYYLYVTDVVRIEVKGQGMTIEDRNGNTIKVDDPFQYLDDDLQFQLGLTDPHIESTRKAVRNLYDLMKY